MANDDKLESYLIEYKKLFFDDIFCFKTFGFMT